MSMFVRYGLTAGAALLAVGLGIGAVRQMGEAEELRVARIGARPETGAHCRAVAEWRRAMGFRVELRDLPVECRG